MDAPQTGWAEQDPELWYRYVIDCTRQLLSGAGPQVEARQVKAVGIGYQMHGLVLVDAQHQVVRPAIIWCDGRAVDSAAAHRA